MDSEYKYEKRFYYIDDSNLRKHMGDAFEFITKLIFQSTLPDYSKEVRSSFIKTSIVYTASLVEANIHYCILKLGYKEFESKKEWNYRVIESLKKINHEGDELHLCKRNKKKYSLEKIDFDKLNNFAYKEAKLYPEKIFKEVDYIRDKRNNIHLMKLKDIDRIYTQTQMNRVFYGARDVFKIVEKKLIN